ncbi:MAG TPA: hypothetical protein PLN61_00200 [bacterium]|nr:hypothetical protein [bacterium]HQI47061.1 hypothetical protein [bacterium]HQJ65382.1 hypothetical protein [bacterium]
MKRVIISLSLILGISLAAAGWIPDEKTIPPEAEFLYKQAVECYDKNIYQCAIDYCSQAIEIESEYADALHLRA